MNPDRTGFLVALLLGALLVGASVLVLVPDYRRPFLVESNRHYIPRIRVEQSFEHGPRQRKEGEARRLDSLPGGKGKPLPEAVR